MHKRRHQGAEMVYCPDCLPGYYGYLAINAFSMRILEKESEGIFPEFELAAEWGDDDFVNCSEALG